MLGPRISFVSHLLMEPILMWTWWRIIQLSHVSNEFLHLHNPNLDMKSQHCPVKNGYNRPITKQFCQWRTFCWFPLYFLWWLNQVMSPFLDCQISMFHNLHPQVWFNLHFWGWNPHLSWWNPHFSWWNPHFSSWNPSFFRRQEAREQREAELRERRAEFSAECKVRRPYRINFGISP